MWMSLRKGSWASFLGKCISVLGLSHLGASKYLFSEAFHQIRANREWAAWRQLSPALPSLNFLCGGPTTTYSPKGRVCGCVFCPWACSDSCALYSYYVGIERDVCFVKASF